MSVFRMHIQKIDKPKCFMYGNSVNNDFKFSRKYCRLLFLMRKMGHRGINKYKVTVFHHRAGIWTQVIWLWSLCAKNSNMYWWRRELLFFSEQEGIFSTLNEGCDILIDEWKGNKVGSWECVDLEVGLWGGGEKWSCFKQQLEGGN